uniref:Uncharacterized protein LOC102806114 n=1 Tax=Saccoglossus kowalevskii TaxID=10224 RepID=A0ABM0MT66_SACKO|nr:PREDICTED: uncharacterized protein LOC102806114 [Saccoglossus kowalevskii]
MLIVFSAVGAMVAISVICSVIGVFVRKFCSRSCPASIHCNTNNGNCDLPPSYNDCVDSGIIVESGHGHDDDLNTCSESVEEPPPTYDSVTKQTSTTIIHGLHNIMNEMQPAAGS